MLKSIAIGVVLLALLISFNASAETLQELGKWKKGRTPH